MATRRKLSHKKALEAAGWYGDSRWGYRAPQHLQSVYWKRYTTKQAVKIMKEHTNAT